MSPRPIWPDPPCLSLPRTLDPRKPARAQQHQTPVYYVTVLSPPCFRRPPPRTDSPRALDPQTSASPMDRTRVSTTLDQYVTDILCGRPLATLFQMTCHLGPTRLGPARLGPTRRPLGPLESLCIGLRVSVHISYCISLYLYSVLSLYTPFILWVGSAECILTS